MCNRRQNPKSRIRSPCDDPAYSQWFSLWWPGTLSTSPKSSRIQNSESGDRLPARSSAWTCDDPASYPQHVQNSDFKCLPLPRADFVQNSRRGGRIQNQESAGARWREWWTRVIIQNPESWEGVCGYGKSRKSRVQNLDQGCERLYRKEKRIQSSELEGTLGRERKRRISY